MTRPQLLWGVFGLWIIAMALSALAWTAAPTGDGFVRGMNRVMGFVGAQLGASILALIAWTLSKPLPKGSAARWAGRLPGWCAVALFVGFLALTLSTLIPDPATP